MATITKQELNNWKKQFQVGDKVKITFEGKYFGMTGVVSSKTSYVYVELENGSEIGFRRGLEVIEKFIKPKKEKVVSLKPSKATKLYKELVDSRFNRQIFSMWLKQNDMVISGEKFDENSNWKTESEEYKNGEGNLWEVLNYFMYNWKLTDNIYASEWEIDGGGFYYSTSWSYDGFSHKSVLITKERLEVLYKKYLENIK